MRIIIPMSHQVCPCASMIICKDIKLSSTMLRKGLQLWFEENDPMSTEGVHKTVARRTWIWGVWLAPWNSPKIFNIAVRLPAPWHSWGHPTLPDLRNCLFLVHINTAELNFVLSVSANFQERMLMVHWAYWVLI